jgi:hypothetical protein
MRRFILPLVVVLFAGPAWATVAITVVDDGGGVAAINYEVSGEPNKVRAFALDITVDTGEIVAISDYMIGEGPGFGIFPASFRNYINVDPATGEVQSWDVSEYTPVADPNDLGALGGLGTNGLTIEMGSLYYPPGDTSPNAPPDSGTLCKLTVSENCKMSVALNVWRAGIVLTNPTVTPTVDLSDATNVPLMPDIICYPGSAQKVKDWIAMGRPICWLAPFQCEGDADGVTETFFKYRVYGKDLELIVENWKRKIDDPLLNPCADIDHEPETFFKYRVYGKDLAIVVGNWKKRDKDLRGDCPRPE